MNLAHRASLIANFYVEFEHAMPLAVWLAQALALGPLPNDTWDSRDTKTRLDVFTHPGAHDTKIIQLVLDDLAGEGAQSREAAVAWLDARQRLENARHEGESLREKLTDLDKKEMIWGYTLIYQAVLRDNNLLAEDLYPEARQLFSSEVPQRILADANLPGGKVWLVDLPLPSQEELGGSIYLALANVDGNDALMKGLVGKGAALLLPDLIAHKGYSRKRQYAAGDLRKQYKEFVNKLNATAEQTLNSKDSTPTEADLENLSTKTGNLLGMLSFFNGIKVELGQQITNYEQWKGGISEGTLADFQQAYLATSSREVELLIELGRGAFEMTRITVEVIRARLAHVAEEREKRVENFIGCAGLLAGLFQVALAFSDADSLEKVFRKSVAVCLTLLIFFLILFAWRKMQRQK